MNKMNKNLPPQRGKKALEAMGKLLPQKYRLIYEKNIRTLKSRELQMISIVLA